MFSLNNSNLYFCVCVVIKTLNEFSRFTTFGCISYTQVCQLSLFFFCGLSRHLLGCHLQIADFGMSRDLMDENYYVSHGGQIPVKWTAPEV